MDIQIIEETSTKLSVNVNGARLILDKRDRNNVQYYSNRKGWTPHPAPQGEFVTSIREALEIQ